MLAVRLHTKKHLSLSKGTHLIPIQTWKKSKVFITRWISMINSGGGKKVTVVRWITLVKIPDSHPICLSLSASAKTFRNLHFVPLAEIPQYQKDKYYQWCDKFACSANLKESQNLPELVLGDSLSEKYVKWTKRKDFLFKNEPPAKSQRRKTKYKDAY